MYVYISTELGLYTVGFYSPDGQWHPESDHQDREIAANRVSWLNGGEKLVVSPMRYPIATEIPRTNAPLFSQPPGQY